MFLYAVAHLLRISDGSFAVRSVHYPGCEGRSPETGLARAQFRSALCERVSKMIEEGKMPTLYHSLDEVKSIFPAHCKMQIVAKDRLPNTFDYGVIELVSLSVDAAELLAAMRLNPNATMMRIRGYWPGWRDRLRASDLTGGAIKKAAGKLLRDGFIEEVPALRTTHRSRHA